MPKFLDGVQWVDASGNTKNLDTELASIKSSIPGGLYLWSFTIATTETISLYPGAALTIYFDVPATNIPSASWTSTDTYYACQPPRIAYWTNGTVYGLGVIFTRSGSLYFTYYYPTDTSGTINSKTFAISSYGNKPTYKKY